MGMVDTCRRKAVKAGAGHTEGLSQALGGQRAHLEPGLCVRHDITRVSCLHMLRGCGRPRAAWCIWRNAVHPQDSTLPRRCELEDRLKAMQQPEEQGDITGTEHASDAGLTSPRGRAGKNMPVQHKGNIGCLCLATGIL